LALSAAKLQLGRCFGQGRHAAGLFALRDVNLSFQAWSASKLLQLCPAWLPVWLAATEKLMLRSERGNTELCHKDRYQCLGLQRLALRKVPWSLPLSKDSDFLAASRRHRRL
jgi:hypothetical protein